MLIVFGITLGLLLIASLTGYVMKLRVQSDEGIKAVENFNARTQSWWVMVAIFGVTLLLGRISTVVLFGMLSFFALREFITLNKTHSSDHRVLFWTFFIILPIQYFLVGIQWYGMFSIFIPVYAFTFIPIRKAIAGETEDFLSSTARIQWGLLVCVYFVSHIPMLLAMPIDGFEGKNTQLLFFFVFTAQCSDVLQYVWGKLLGKRKIAPLLSPNKTVEGTIGGIASTVLLAAGLWWLTPFNPLAAFFMALLICLAGFAGGLVLSAIKRDLGAKDWGQSIRGHGGFMDRLDSLCFAAPLFFHLTLFYYSSGDQPSLPEWLLKLLGK